MVFFFIFISFNNDPFNHGQRGCLPEPETIGRNIAALEI